MTERNLHLLDGIDFTPLEQNRTEWNVKEIFDDPDASYSERIFEIRKGMVKLDLRIGSWLTELHWVGDLPEVFIPGGGKKNIMKYFGLQDIIIHDLPTRLFPDSGKNAQDYRDAYKAFSNVKLGFVEDKKRRRTKYELRDEGARMRLSWNFLDDSIDLESMTVTGSDAPRDDFGYILDINYNWSNHDMSIPNMSLGILNKRRKAWNQDALEWILDTAKMKNTAGDLHESAEKLSGLIIPRVNALTATA